MWDKRHTTSNRIFLSYRQRKFIDSLISNLFGCLGPVIIPPLHIYVLYHFWHHYTRKVDKHYCTCSCWDTVFKGTYESGIASYKHVYFNATRNSAKIWVLTVLCIIGLYEAVKRLIGLVLKHRLRVSMLILFMSSIFSHYYSWWSFFNYWNDEFYSQWEHQMWFSLSELLSSLLVLQLADTEVAVRPVLALPVVAVASIHVVVASQDQFLFNVMHGKGSKHQTFGCMVCLQRIEIGTKMKSLLAAYLGIFLCGLSILLTQCAEHSLRLPRTLLPSHYRIKLIPFLVEGNFTTQGEEWVELDCVLTTDQVVFNVNNMTIDSDSVSVHDIATGREHTISHQEHNSEMQKYSLVVSPNLEIGSRYLLHVRFVSVLNDLLQGLYRSSYIESETGQLRWLAASQFSPTDARRAFPCWDEPLFKARFTVSLGRRTDMRSWSNMPINDTVPIEGLEGWVWDNFFPTVPMSTYLVAFMVSDLESLGVFTLPSGLKFQVISRKDELRHTRYVASIGPKILTYLEDYFKIKFPLPKLDLVAVPDFGFMAMENWGFITFRESCLLYDPAEDSLLNQDLTASITGHELAHQWFGNLVTPAWWEDLWLKEGFATYIGYLAVNDVEPEWRYKEQFVLDKLQQVMVMDSLLSSHQISVPLDDPKDITQIFDAISYMKGASIIRMMQHFMSRAQFKAGLTLYLEQFAYNNTRQDQLWQVLTDHRQGSALPADVTVKDVMDSWTLQVGYPVITVTRDYQAGTAQVTQDRFLLSGRRANDSARWWVPLSYTTQRESTFHDTMPRLWLSDRQNSTYIDELQRGEWLLVNVNQSGFYRVNYDEENWAMLMADFEQLPELTRAQLLNDALSLARAGRTPYSTALNLTKHLYNDHSYFTWTAVKPESRYIHDMLCGTSAYQNYKRYVLKMLRVREMNLTLDPGLLPTGLLERLHRCNIIMLACQLDFAPLISEVRNLTTAWMAGQDPLVTPDLKAAVYCTAVANGDQKVWQYFWSLYLSSKTATDRDDLLRALGCSRDMNILSRYLNMILDESADIRKQDGSIVFISVANNKLGYSLAFDFLANRWHEIQEYFGLGFGRVSRMVLSLSRFLHAPEDLERLKALQRNHTMDLGSTAQDMEHTIEIVSNNVVWHQAYHDEINEWLSEAVTTF